MIFKFVNIKKISNLKQLNIYINNYIINKEVRYMKLNKNGWGYRMMAFLMGLLIIALLVLFYLLYSYLDSVKGLELKTKNIEVVEKIWKN